MVNCVESSNISITFPPLETLIEIEPSAGCDLASESVSHCPHKTKKGLFKSSLVRKSLNTKIKRNALNKCEDCARSSETVNNDSIKLFICVSCGHIGCEKYLHASKHFEALRVGFAHSIFLSPEDNSFRCFSCNEKIIPQEKGGEILKSFFNDYASFLKLKDRNTGHRDSAQPSCSSNEDTSSSDLKQNNSKSDSNKGKNNISLTKNVSLNRPQKNGVVKGLINLGNTCFFNSVIQCILRTQPIASYVDSVGKNDSVKISDQTVIVNDKTVQIPATRLILTPFNGSLNEQFAYFVRQSLASHSVHPSALFSEIAKKAPRFRGWSQQDAHELLRYLLDGLRSEELDRYKSAIADYIGIPKSMNPHHVEPNKLLKAKGMLIACRRPLLDAVFGGTLLQTIKCCECGHLSQTFEQFFDLSVPLPCTSGKGSFMGGNKIPKSSSVALSKHQRKKERACARKVKRHRRKSNFDASVTGVQLSPSDIESSSDDQLNEPNETEGRDIDGLQRAFYCLDVKNTASECTQILGNELSMEPGPTLTNCLISFTSTELLSAPNTYECEKCCLPYNKKIQNGSKMKSVEAEKRYLIYEPPVVLTIHLKRFEQVHSVGARVSTRKVSGHIDFPVLLDLAPFCTKIARRVESDVKKIIYSLYGVVSHSGDLSGGHYVAYVRCRPRSHKIDKFFRSAADAFVENNVPINSLEASLREEEDDSEGQWFYASDTRICAVAQSRVLASEAYILFYERVV